MIKSLKPPKTYTLAVQSSDTIADIKSYLASQPGAPPVDVQRLLLKGKALADAKLLKEYNIKDGDTVNLMVKPGYDWNQPAQPPKLEIPVPQPVPPAEEPSSTTLEPGTKPERHRRVPSVILSPSPNTLTPLREGAPIDVAISLDDGDILSPAHAPPTPYQNVISSPDFWGDLLDFLRLAKASLIHVYMVFNCSPQPTFHYTVGCRECIRGVLQSKQGLTHAPPNCQDSRSCRCYGNGRGLEGLNLPFVFVIFGSRIVLVDCKIVTYIPGE